MKKTAEGKEMILERVMELYPGIGLYKVHVERCREQDKNAQVMSKETFDRLKHTIEQDGRLESLPFGFVRENPSGNTEFHIISGHHRIRASRMAGIKEIFVLAQEDDLNDDAVKAKQLAHNALVGNSDPQVLKEIYDSIRDIDYKIRSGVREEQMDKDRYKNVQVDDLSIDFEFKTVKFMFLSHQLDKLDEVAEQINSTDAVRIAPLDQFDKFTETIRELSKAENVRNIGSLIERMCEIVSDHVASLKTIKALEENA